MLSTLLVLDMYEYIPEMYSFSLPYDLTRLGSTTQQQANTEQPGKVFTCFTPLLA